MKCIFNIITIALFAMLLSCQENATTTNNSGEISGAQHENMTKPTTSLVNEDGTKRKAWAIVTADLWHYEFALTVSETPKTNIYEGYWIDFEDDFTFIKGKYADTLSVGEYNFDFDTKILEILPTAGDEGPSEYRIQTNGEIIILIGTQKYGNNSTQIKLKREREIPTLEVSK